MTPEEKLARAAKRVGYKHSQSTIMHSVLKKHGFDWKKMPVPEQLKKYTWCITPDVRSCACKCGETFECRRLSKQRFINGHATREVPNTSEILLGSILNELFPGVYKFVGDFSLKIDGKNPDFISESDKKIIELYGERWHKVEDELIKVNHFKKHGYSCLVIWYMELKRKKNRAALKQRIVNFHTNQIWRA